MAKLRYSASATLASSFLFILAGNASAQTAPAPASAAFPPTEPTPAPAPVAAPAPAPGPAPAPATPPPPPPPQPQTTYASTEAPIYEPPPPPPPQPPDEGFQRPDISIRVDPFNLLLEGRLGLELETQLASFLTVELVPVFVTTKSPPTLNYSSYSSVIEQKSNGLGPIAGAAIDAGFWFGGKPFRGNVLRVGFTNYGYQYDAIDDGVQIDTVKQTNRQFFVMLGQHSRWGAFTIAGGIGLGYELNKQNRCFDGAGAATGSCPKDQLLIKLDNRGGPPGDLQGFLYPFDLMARFSLGVVF